MTACNFLWTQASKMVKVNLNQSVLEVEMFTANESNIDRIIRVVVGILLLWLGWGGIAAGTLGLVFKVLGFIPLITGVIGWCPLYALFKFSTHKA
jgi:hypothetical protein